MIGTSFSEYIFIRVIIVILRFWPLILATALVLALIVDHDAHGFTVFLETIAIVEFFFYVIIYIPRSRWLQAPATHPSLLSKAERQRFFEKTQATISDGEAFFSLWFSGAPMRDIRRENIKDFFAWSFLNAGAYGPEDGEELEGYTNATEELLGRKLEPGRGKAVPIRTTLDPVEMQHRPLLWYMIVGLVDDFTALKFFLSGFHYYRLSASYFLSRFPWRPWTLLSRRTSPGRHFSYWIKPHTSRTRLPVVFIHGIGVGLYPYTQFLASINSQMSPDDGQIGIIAIEMSAISSRIAPDLPKASEMVSEVLKILAAHNITQFVLVSHSYGAVVASQLMHNPTTSRLITSSVFIDPVCFLLHHPHIAYNFLRRPPKRANEWQLHYFASTDPMVAHELSRNFFWAQKALWKEELRGKNVTVVLAGKDLIVDTLSVGRYLAEDAEDVGSRRNYRSFAMDSDDEAAEATGDVDTWKDMDWKGEGLDIVWLENADHARVFETRAGSARMASITRAYCAGT